MEEPCEFCKRMILFWKKQTVEEEDDRSTYACISEGKS